MKRRLTYVALCVLAITTLVGCAAIETKARSQKLTDQVKAYTKAIRWGDFDIATRFLKHRNGKPARTEAGSLQGIRVTHYDYSIQADRPEAEEAEMVATFDYQLPSSASVRRIKQRATWWYDAKIENWYLDGDLPKF